MRWFKDVIKADIIGFMFLCFLVGTIFIWFTGSFVSFPLSAGEKINATVLWLTALAIFWYAYETYQLKQSTSKQVELQEEIMLNEFLPIVAPVRRGTGPVFSGGNLTKLCLRNLGRGPAKYVSLQIARVRIPVDLSLGGGEESAVQLPAAERRRLATALSERAARVVIKIRYEDIYGRKFVTDHIYLDRGVRGGAYYLRQRSWDFKRLSGNRPQVES